MNAKSTALLAALLLVAIPCAASTEEPPEMSPGVTYLGLIEEVPPPPEGWFTEYKDPQGPYDAQAQIDIYGAKHPNRAAQPPIQRGIRLYDRGAYTPRPTWLGAKNPIGFHFLSYGDLRVAAAWNDNGVAAANGETDQSSVAVRLNLDMDVAFTATERVHAFVRPFDKNGSFTRFAIHGGEESEFIDELDFDLETLFFEGDAGAISQGLMDKRNAIDLPFAIGRVPLLTQNGIWMLDTFDGLAFSITAKSSPRFDISNMDLTVFAGFDNVSTAAAPGNDNKMYGLAGFADAFKGYIEVGYGFLDAKNGDQSYHNVSAAFTKRYRGLVSNSVRVIGNFGQKAATKTADGVLLLVENSFTHNPFTKSNPIAIVPYANFFAGFDSPQPMARAADVGGVLVNTGISFESDGLTRYPTLDATAKDSYGGAVGLEYIFPTLNRQIVVEGAVVERMNGNPLGSEYAIGARYQHVLSNAWLVRLDAMHGWRQGRNDVFGARIELRRKF